MKVYTHENRARVGHHLNGGYTAVIITDAVGTSLHLSDFQIPTVEIPQSLRKVGSRFLLRWRAIWPDDNDSVDDIRKQIAHAFEVVTGTSAT